MRAASQFSNLDRLEGGGEPARRWVVTEGGLEAKGKKCLKKKAVTSMFTITGG